MKITKGRPKVVDDIMDAIAERYQVTQERGGIHCTDCIYCIRRAFWNKTSPLKPTHNELLFFILGLGLQDALLGDSSPDAVEVDGVIVSPDHFKDMILGELKSTRMSEKSIDEQGLPEGWIKQMMAYVYALKAHGAFMIVLPLIRPDVLSYVLTFTKAELDDNWKKILEKAEELKEALATGTVPSGVWGTWLCQHCRYYMRCNVMEHAAPIASPMRRINDGEVI